jgi:8-oxo-dGTP diphosphatase
MRRTHILARAVILGPQDQILLAQAVGQSNTFLPGGHLDPREGLQEALVREIDEELGLAARVG